MNTAQRVKVLLDRHGDNICEAAAKTDVPKSTLHRILQGSRANLHKWVPKIAQAYSVQPESLMGEHDSKADFEWSIRHSVPRERFEMCVMTVQDRVRMTLHFMLHISGQPCSLAQVAIASTLGLAEVTRLIALWRHIPPDLVTTRLLISGIHTLAGISLAWFNTGALDDEVGLRAVSRHIPRATCLAPATKQGHVAALISIAHRRLQDVI